MFFQSSALLKRRLFRNVLSVLLTVSCASFLVLPGCSSSSVEDLVDEVEDVIDSLDPGRKTIDVTRLGTNAFVNDGRFGSIGAQFQEVRDSLGLRFVRVLFRWDDNVQPAPNSSLNFSFYDDIARNLPAGLDALVVVTGTPSWMANPANWDGGNPRLTYVQRFLRAVAQRYGGNSRIIGFQVWNEPNNPDFVENSVLEVLESPTNYVELISLGANAIRDNAPGKLVVNGATTSINQNFPRTLDYNRALRDAGMLDLVDIFAIHYYGNQFERVVQSGGIRGFLTSLGKVIWITESGRQGVNSQLGYGETAWPFLRGEIPQIDRIYQYQFTESTAPDVTFGLRTLDPSFPVSDLYVHLNQRARG